MPAYIINEGIVSGGMFIAIGESIIARVAALGGYISFSVTDCPKTRYEQVQLLWYTATIHVPYMYGAWEVREDYWTKPCSIRKLCAQPTQRQPIKRSQP